MVDSNTKLNAKHFETWSGNQLKVKPLEKTGVVLSMIELVFKNHTTNMVLDKPSLQHCLQIHGTKSSSNLSATQPYKIWLSQTLQSN